MSMGVMAVPDQPTGLAEFVEAAGASLSNAQKMIAGAELATTAVAVAEASLEAKVALQSDGGEVKVVPIGTKLLSDPEVNVGSVSTLTVNFVALADDSVPTARTPPKVARDEAIGRLAGRDDVKRLADILGGLEFEANLIAERSGWLVSARDPAGRLVRETVITDFD